MTREEYIKILREVQNEIKRQMIDCLEFKRLYPKPTKESMEKDAINCMGTTLIYAVLTFLSYELDWPQPISLLLFLIALYNNLYTIYDDKLNNEIIECYKTIEDIFNKWKMENVKIENCIKFFNETPEEDIKKYLGYKNNFLNL